MTTKSELVVPCNHCGNSHNGMTCPRVKAIEYHENGTIKRIEFKDDAPVFAPYPMPMPTPYQPPVVPPVVPTWWQGPHQVTCGEVTVTNSAAS